MFEVQALSAFNDNYIWLIKNKATKQCAVVDPGDATPVLQWLAQNPQWQLTTILITHHHQDHTGGINLLKQQTTAIVLTPNNPSIPHSDIILTNNQLVNILGKTAQIITVPGHTLDHIVYYFPKQLDDTVPWLFSGDTLFAGGCGRVFEGTMEQMYYSLEQLRQLPDETLIYAAHEYTVSNLKFATAVEPENSIIKQRLEHCLALREKLLNTLPSTISLEKQTNPFLRCGLENLRKTASFHIKQELESPVEIFTTLREWKNNF
ncbi:hydroxyacylglutathione hydrolase [Entomomonas asaccharolytica]|uniref:Hydroxyacylglutathione hydrolase n=1 Tax=Entomomonas asaccharolytica TaxID=2785331 RepID=A0A974NFJ0_9GAMM|nr:hydroxyacylglutathione hydrolase [Entomomonas asaccharolytica]QQP85487.1 hydroxyacylglutathione hydrolase [Entomomonas asaccharolytica]